MTSEPSGPADGRAIPVTARLAAYVAGALERPLQPVVAERATLHLLDTVAAIVSGSALEAGHRILPFVCGLGGAPECSVLASTLRTNASNAALANGTFAHADETDDSHAPSLTHPGCAIVPAALAMAERADRSGADLLRAVVLGYDVGTRLAMALGGSRFADRYHHSSHAFGGVFGATAAASALAGLDATQTGHALSHAVQMASGNRCWLRDPDHVQKAFIFGGMPAEAGVRAALMASAGITGASEPLEGVPGLFAAFAEEADPAVALDGLGERFEVMRTSLKKWTVGSPIQAALDALEELVREHGLGPDDVAGILVTLPAQRALVVDSRMPNIDLRHLLGLYLVDGGLTFASTHDPVRMGDPRVVEVAERVRVEARPGAARHEQAVLALTTRDGRRFMRAPSHVRGQPADPMTLEEVTAKAQDLALPVLGEEKGSALVGRLADVGSLANLRELGAMWQT